MDSAGKPLSRVSAFVAAPPELGDKGWPSQPLPFLSRGFRPFFLGAGVCAIVPVGLAAGLHWTEPWGTAADDIAWHAHELLFGYGGALLAGFLLTAVPNWTGRRPLTGLPLLGLFLVWLTGRMAAVSSDPIATSASVAADAAFLPLVLLLTAREVVAARNWRNLKTVALLGLFAVANLWCLATASTGGDGQSAIRLGVAALIGLVMLINGRVTPHFTREWLVSTHARRLPHPFDRYDDASLVVAALALAAWSIAADTAATAALLAAAGVAHAVRLARWAGHTVWRQPMILILHIGYGFVPLGFLLMAIATVAPALVAATAALHAWTIGAVGATALAVMTRATRSHTGRRVAASPLTALSYAAVVSAALLRVASGIVSGWQEMLIAAAAALWIAAHTAFLLEYGPMLVTDRKKQR